MRIQWVSCFIDLSIRKQCIETCVETDKTGQVQIAGGSNHTFERDQGRQFFVLYQGHCFEINMFFLFILQSFKTVESVIHVINKNRQNVVTILHERRNLVILGENFLNHAFQRTDRTLL